MGELTAGYYFATPIGDEDCLDGKPYEIVYLYFDGSWQVIRPGLVKSEDPSRWNLFKESRTIPMTKMSNELKLIDWSKPIEHVCGINQVKWLVSLQGSHSHRHVVLFSNQGSEDVHHLNDYGCWNDTTPCVRNVPERTEFATLNIYKGGTFSVLPNKAAAETVRGKDCEAVVSIYKVDGKYESEVEYV